MNPTTAPAWLHLLPAPLRAKLAGRTNLLAVINNSSWLLLDKLVRMALGLLVGAWVARYLGPTQYGELAYVLAYIAFFQSVANLGMDGIIVRDIALNKEQAGQILGTAFALRMAAGSVCWLLAVGGMATVNGWQDRSVWLTAIAAGTLVFQAADTVDLWFQSQSQSRRTVVSKLFAYLLSNGVKVALVLVHAPLLAFAAVMALEALIAAAGLALAYRRFPSHQRWQQVSQQGKQLLKESWPFMLSGLTIMVYMRIDQIMIKEILGDNALGIYAAVLPIAQAPNFIPMMLSTSLMPFVSQTFKNNQTNYENILIIIFRVFFYFALGLSVIIAILAQDLINILYGAQFHQAGSALKVYIISNCFTWLGIAHSLWLINEKKSKTRLYGTLISATTCTLMNLLLLPRFGINAAAWIAIATQLIAAVGINIVMARKSFEMQMCAIFFIRKTK